MITWLRPRSLTPVIDDPRALGIRSCEIAGDVHGHDLAAAAAQRVVLAARARLGGSAPGAKRSECIGRIPVRRERVDLGALAIDRRGRGGEAARGELATGLRADEEVAAAAPVDREVGEQLRLRPMM